MIWKYRKHWGFFYTQNLRGHFLKIQIIGIWHFFNGENDILIIILDNQ